MQAERSFFKAVLRQFIENFTPRMTQKLSEYEFLAKSVRNKEQALTTIFRHFPGSSKEYVSMVDTLVVMAKCQPVMILSDILDLCAQVVENDRNNIFAAILSLLPLYNNNVEEHRLFLYHTWLFCVSELVMRITQDHKVGELHERMIEILLKIVNAEKKIAVLLDRLLHLWAVTVAAVSNDGGISKVTKAFRALVDDGKTREAFKLVQYVDIHNDGFDEFKEAIIDAMRRENGISQKDWGSCMSHICRLIINCEKDEKFLNSVVEYSHDETMVETITRMILDGGLTWEFVEKRIMGMGKPSVKALFWAMTGPVFPKQLLFKFNFDMKNILKSLEQRALEWDEHGRIVDKYMEFIFPSAVYCEDHWVCHFILIMLAVRYFDAFLEKVVPPFSTLETSDPRMIVMLMALKELNELSLLEPDQLRKLNKMFADTLRQALFIFPSTISEKAVIISEDDEILGPIINDHTQAVALFLDSIKNDVFKETVCSFSTARPPSSQFMVEILIAQVMIYVLEPDDLLELLEFWVELTCHLCSGISEAAFKICIFLSDRMPSNVISKLANIAMECEGDEKLFHIIKLVSYILKTHQDLAQENLQDIDFIGLLASISVHPEVRMLAQLLLEKVGVRMKDGGFYKVLKDHRKSLESAIKRRIILSATVLKGSDDGKITTQTGEISIRLVCGSYFYDIWLLVLSEIMKLLIAVNQPILKLIDERLSTAKTFRGLLLFVASAYYYPVFDSLTSPYPITPEGRNTEPSDDMQVRLYQILMGLIENNKPGQALRMIQCVHFSFYAIVAQVLPFVGEDLIVEATRTLVVFLRSPEVTKDFVESMMVFVLQFLQVVQNYFIQQKLNAPRVLTWDQASEELVVKHQSVVLNYILIIVKSLPDSQVSEEEWPIAARDLTFRFLINWSLTKSPDLALVREYAMNGIVTISRVGAIFTDSLLFDKKVVKLFGKYERRGFSIAQYLLYYHPELLLDIFILAYFCQPRKIADAYLESFLVLGGNAHSDVIYQSSGQFLLLLFVLKTRGHELADELMSFFVKTVMAKKRRTKMSLQQIAKQLEEEPYYTVIPECFRYATEAVFDFAFNLMGMKLHVPINDICDALVPWIANVRLLPKRGQCADDVTSDFNFFTPYQFLTKFMEMSGVVKDDQFLNVSTLWTELMRSPDHSELIPLFFMSWTNATLKKKIFDLLLRNDPIAITKRLCQHCTFAYYYYVTDSLEKPFEDELWVLKIIFEGFHRYWNDVCEEVLTVIHFAYLFRFHETADLFELICNKLEIDLGDEENLVQRIAEKIGNSEEWGNEALKWVVGSKSIRLASVSLEVYNQIKTPAFDPSLLARVVLYHVQSTPTEVRDLILESFGYLANKFAGNEAFAVDFLMSFLDSTIYVATSSSLLLKILSSGVAGRKAWPLIVPMVKPLLGRLEGNENLEKMIDLFIRTSRNEELQLIIAPLKEVEPLHFPSSPMASVLMKSVNESTMCKCLAHYANMINTVSVRVVNAIFGVATLILQRVPSHENNLIHLAKLYSVALHTLSQCPNAVPFITALMQKEPSVATISFMEVIENERTLEDVERSLERLSKKEDEIFGSCMTDCKSYTNVVGFTDLGLKPKILPFTTHQDMIDGMLKVNKITKIQKTLSLRRLNVFHSTTNTVIRSTVMSISTLLVPSASEVNMRAMMHPKQLIITDMEDVEANSYPDLIYSPEVFLAASTL